MVTPGGSRFRWGVSAAVHVLRVPAAGLTPFWRVGLGGAGWGCAGVGGVYEVGDGGLITAGFPGAFFGGPTVWWWGGGGWW